MVDNFGSDLARGKVGEKLFYDLMIKRGHTVIDLTDNADARRKDIDFRVHFKSGNVVNVEVKTDEKSQKSCKLFIEYFNMHHKEYKGWYRYSEADFLVFVQPLLRLVYVVSRHDLVECICAHDYDVGSSGNALGWLLPIDDLMKLPSYIKYEV